MFEWLTGPYQWRKPPPKPPKKDFEPGCWFYILGLLSWVFLIVWYLVDKK